MEAFYSQVHLHDQFVADLPKGKGRRRAYEWAMKYFLRVIPSVFGCSLAGNRCAWHDALASSLNARDVILSFNYDCLMDESLRHAAKRKWLAASGYGVAATGEIGDWQDHSGYGRFPKVGLRLYKLHGSLNWRVGAGGDLELLSDPYETRPDGELCIVPPLWQKSFDAAPFRDIWLAARGVLTRVKALLVIGYSLPLTDVYTQAMLRIDVPDLDFLLIANPDSEARQRTRYILRSALRSSTRVVELDEVRDVGQLLGADAGNAGGGPGVDGLDSGPHDSNGQA
jgi:hypothetical protein